MSAAKIGLIPALICICSLSIGCLPGCPPPRKDDTAITHYHPNGVMSESIEYKLVKDSGKRDFDTVYSGTWKNWDSLGRMTSRKRYRDGKLDGDSEDWYRSGRPQVKLSYRAGNLDSGVFWYESGIVSKRIRVGGKVDTLYVYDESGKLLEIVPVEEVQ